MKNTYGTGAFLLFTLGNELMSSTAYHDGRVARRCGPGVRAWGSVAIVKALVQCCVTTSVIGDW